jgi:hypothetical protein
MGLIKKKYVLDTPLEPEQIYDTMLGIMAKPPVFIRLRKTEKQFIGEINKDTLRFYCDKKTAWLKVIGEYNNGKYHVNIAFTLTALIFFSIQFFCALLWLSLIILDKESPKPILIFVLLTLLIFAGIIKTVYDLKKERAITIDKLANILKATIKEV